MRTDVSKVRAVIETDSDISVDPYIRTANVVVNRIEANDDGDLTTPELLVEIETYLAAHYYSLRDPQYLSKSTGNASGSFAPRNWWNEAKMLDPTNTLAAMEAGNPRAEIIWLGKSVSEETDYWDRN